MSTTNPTQISPPMLPLEVCLSLLGVLSTEDTQQILYAILDLLHSDDLSALIDTSLKKYLAKKSSGLVKYIPADFTSKILAALEKLQKDGAENVLYYTALWCLSSERETDLNDVTVGQIIGFGLAHDENTMLEEINSVATPRIEVVPEFNEAMQSYVKPKVLKRKVGRPRVMVKQDKEWAKPVTIKKEVIEEDKLDGDASRRSKRISQGKTKKKFEDDPDWDASMDNEELGSDDEMVKDTDGEVELRPQIKIETVDDNVKKVETVKIKAKVASARTEFPCSLCDEVFEKYLDMRKHYNTSHDGEAFPVCEQCKKPRKFRNQAALDAHVKENHSANICEVCGKEFKTKHTLMKHGLVHGATPKFSCEKCGKGFTSNYGLTLHINVNHKGIKPFLCTVCGNGFTSKGSLSEHMNMHNGLTPHKCTICDLAFARKSALRLHHLSEHNEKTKNVKCEVCGKVYRNIYILNNHRKLHMNPKERPEKEIPTCDECGRKFKGKHELLKHKKVVHLKIKEFNCSYCGKLFATRVHLQEHTATHTREAQFFCDICGEGFIHRVTYKAHVFRHNGAKLCRCPICNKKFDVPRFLVRHIKDVHKDLPMPELPNFDIPKSRLAKHLRRPTKSSRLPEPPAVPAIGCEKTRPVGETKQQKQQQQQIEQQMAQEQTYHYVAEILEGENANTVQTVELGQSDIVQIFDQFTGAIQEEQMPIEMVTENGAILAEAAEMEGGEEMYHDNAAAGAGEVKGEVEEEGMRYLELEIDGQRETIHVPPGAEYVQVGDKIISLQDIL